MAQRTLQIFVNDQFYKDLVVEVDNTNSYDVGFVLAIINADKEAGLLTPYGNEPYGILVKLNR